MSTVRVPIHSRKYPKLYALIDEEDAELVMQYRWNVVAPPTKPGKYYARARIAYPDQWEYMHRLIAGPRSDEEVDHWNGDGLDNRRKNLRACETTGNNQNRRRRKTGASMYCGVWRQKKRWAASIDANHRRYLLGTFATEEEAARAYDAKARELHGEFATLNFPLPGERGTHDPHARRTA